MENTKNTSLDKGFTYVIRAVEKPQNLSNQQKITPIPSKQVSKTSKDQDSKIEISPSLLALEPLFKIKKDQIQPDDNKNLNDPNIKHINNEIQFSDIEKPIKYNENDKNHILTVSLPSSGQLEAISEEQSFVTQSRVTKNPEAIKENQEKKIDFAFTYKNPEIKDIEKPQEEAKKDQIICKATSLKRKSFEGDKSPQGEKKKDVVKNVEFNTVVSNKTPGGSIINQILNFRKDFDNALVIDSNFSCTKSSYKTKSAAKRKNLCPRIPNIQLKILRNVAEGTEFKSEIYLEDFLKQLEDVCRETFNGLDCLNVFYDFFEYIRKIYAEKLDEHKVDKRKKIAGYQKSLEIFKATFSRFSKISIKSPEDIYITQATGHFSRFSKNLELLESKIQDLNSRIQKMTCAFTLPISKPENGNSDKFYEYKALVIAKIKKHIILYKDLKNKYYKLQKILQKSKLKPFECMSKHIFSTNDIIKNMCKNY